MHKPYQTKKYFLYLFYKQPNRTKVFKTAFLLHCIIFKVHFSNIMTKLEKIGQIFYSKIYAIFI